MFDRLGKQTPHRTYFELGLPRKEGPPIDAWIHRGRACQVQAPPTIKKEELLDVCTCQI